MELDDVGLVHSNGIDARTGQYLDGRTEAELADTAVRIARGGGIDEDINELVRRRSEAHRGLDFLVEPTDISAAGWAAVVPTELSPGHRDALAALVDHRRAQAGSLARVLDYRPGETWKDWLVRHEAVPGSIDPHRVPYYVTLVGTPAQIPWSFEQMLGTEYAVGRLDFDTAAQLEAYGRSVARHENAAFGGRDPTALFFGTEHPRDPATYASRRLLVERLGAPEGADITSGTTWETALLPSSDCTKDALMKLLVGTGPVGRPAIVFAAAHGLGGFSPGSLEQLTRQGSIVCQEWPGPGEIDAPVSPEFAVGAGDLAADADVGGLVCFLFACFSAGTPQGGSFPLTDRNPTRTAPAPFTAALPRRLLSHEAGSALGVIGHVDRAWGYSYLFGGNAAVLPFRNTVGRAMRGIPLGHAMRDLRERSGVLAHQLLQLVRQVEFGRAVPPRELATLWLQHEDALHFTLLGDPAARLGAQRMQRRFEPDTGAGSTPSSA